MRTALTALAVLLAVALGCGGGGVIIFVNTGTVVSNPSCDQGRGSFDLLNQGGLVLLVVINSDTVIFNADGMRGRCTDLVAGTHVQVRGPQHGSQVTAQTVNVQ